MTGQSIIPVVIDSDNALGPGSSIGDVDDAFALSFLLKSQFPIQEIWSVGGNTSAKKAHLNNLSLVQKAGQKITCSEGLGPGEIKDLKLSIKSKVSYLSLGPLTNLASFLKAGLEPDQIWMTLGRISTKGYFPPFWPMEFNATKDLAAFQQVLSSKIPITVVPLDVAYRLKIKSVHFKKLKESELGRYLLKYSQRWRWRNALIKGRKNFPVWDLLSAMNCVHPEVCEVQKGQGYLFKNGLFLCDVLNQPMTKHNRQKSILSRDIKIVTNFDEEKLWSYFFNAIERP